jgi:hypothetical protein
MRHPIIPLFLVLVVLNRIAMQMN